MQKVIFPPFYKLPSSTKRLQSGHPGALSTPGEQPACVILFLGQHDPIPHWAESFFLAGVGS